MLTGGTGCGIILERQALSEKNDFFKFSTKPLKRTNERQERPVSAEKLQDDSSSESSKASKKDLTKNHFGGKINRSSAARLRRTGPWKLNNIEKLVRNLYVFGKTLKTIPKVIHTGRKRLRAERTRFNTLKVINIIYKEFDPGSGRTLAARLTHASRTELRELAF